MLKSKRTQRVYVDNINSLRQESLSTIKNVYSLMYLIQQKIKLITFRLFCDDIYYDFKGREFVLQCLFEHV